MSKAKTGDESPLTQAAAALDAELRRYVDLAEQISRAPLGSEKAVERVSRSIVDAVQTEQRVLDLVKELVIAVTAAREAQQRSTEIINERGAAIAAKRAEIEELLLRFQKIGEVARGLNEAMQKVATYKPDPYDHEGTDAMLGTLAAIETGMGECAGHADGLTKDAQTKGLEDIARQSDGLRQTLLSTKNRLALLQKQLGRN
jgi:hypothetical protein